MTIRLIVGWGLTLAYLIVLVVFIATVANTSFVTPENSGKVWSAWELLKIAGTGLGVWAAGLLVGTTVRRGQ